MLVFLKGKRWPELDTWSKPRVKGTSCSGSAQKPALLFQEQPQFSFAKWSVFAHPMPIHSHEVYSTETTSTLPAPLEQHSPALIAAFVNSGGARIIHSAILIHSAPAKYLQERWKWEHNFKDQLLEENVFPNTSLQMEDSMVYEFMQKHKGRINAQLRTKGFFISHHSNTVLPMPKVTLLHMSTGIKT